LGLAQESWLTGGDRSLRKQDVDKQMFEQDPRDDPLGFFTQDGVKAQEETVSAAGSADNKQMQDIIENALNLPLSKAADAPAGP
jgi:tRNA U34 5-carboxymethylaminomethyl modifying enzyme MnmG/GidA